MSFFSNFIKKIKSYFSPERKLVSQATEQEIFEALQSKPKKPVKNSLVEIAYINEKKIKEMREYASKNPPKTILENLPPLPTIKIHNQKK